MFTGSIKISELSSLASLLSPDFFPVVQSGSLTTFRVDISTLNNWFKISGSVLSASYAPFTQSVQISGSWASQSLSSSYSLTSSKAISSSYSLTSSNAITSSYALSALSASFAPFTQSVQVSASWASASLSSSYALSASYSQVIGDTVPVGTIMAFAATTAANNWLECDGQAKLTSSFSDLYNAIQTTDLTASFGYLCDSFGNRNVSGSYFKLPDLRGEFLRGWDHSRGVDVGRTFASSQTSAVGNHSHSIFPTTRVQLGTDNGEAYGVDAHDGAFFTKFTGTNNGGIETRPRNISVLWCIKYTNATNLASTGNTIAGDVVGTLSASNVVRIQNIPVTSSAPADGQFLVYNATASVWAPSYFSPVVSQLPRAYAVILQPTASNFNNFIGVCGFNVLNVTASSTNLVTSSWETNLNKGMFTLHANLPGKAIIINFSSSMPTPYYTVVFTNQGYEPFGFESVTPYFSPSGQTTNGFTMSFAGGDSSNNEARFIANFVVYHP